MSPRQFRRAAATLGVGLFVLTLVGCKNTGTDSAAPSSTSSVSGARSALFSLEELIGSQMIAGPRPGALLGLYVAEYLSRGMSTVVQSALKGIDAQTALAKEGESVQDEDYALLQAFADALSVDIPDLLNRSTDRQESLTRYLDALKNVGTRAQDRFKELETAIDTIRDREREQQKEISTLEKQQRTAMNEKDFGTAGELQQQLSEKEATLSETKLELEQTRSIAKTFEDLIDIYGKRFLALEANRQALITGVTVVNVPGAEDFNVLATPTRKQQRQGLDSIMNGNGMLDILHIDGQKKE